MGASSIWTTSSTSPAASATCCTAPHVLSAGRTASGATRSPPAGVGALRHFFSPDTGPSALPYPTRPYRTEHPPERETLARLSVPHPATYPTSRSTPPPGSSASHICSLGFGFKRLHQSTSVTAFDVSDMKRVKPSGYFQLNNSLMWIWFKGMRYVLGMSYVCLICVCWVGGYPAEICWGPCTSQMFAYMS